MTERMMNRIHHQSLPYAPTRINMHCAYFCHAFFCLLHKVSHISYHIIKMVVMFISYVGIMHILYIVIHINNIS